MQRQDPTFETLIPVNRCVFDDAVAHTLRGEGFDASEDGTGRGTPLVPIAYRTSGNCGAWETGDKTDALTTGTDPNSHVIAFTSKDYGNDATADLSPTLRSMGHADSHANRGGQVAIAMQAGMVRENPNSGPDGKGWQPDIAYTLEARAEVQAVAFDTTQLTSPANYSNPQPGDPCHPLAAGAHVPAVAMQEPFTIMERGREGQSSLEYWQDGTANAILTPNGGRGGLGVGAIATEWAVRRLTPAECEILQGYPVGHTLIETNKRRTVEADEAEYLRHHGAIVTLGNDGKLRTNAAADGPRYKALGNAWAVRCARWILERIASMTTPPATEGGGR